MDDKLFKAIQKKLEENGTLGHLRSEFELRILNLVGITRILKDRNRPRLNGGNVIDELVAEYLQWSGYSMSSAIFNSDVEDKNNDPTTSNGSGLKTKDASNAGEPKTESCCEFPNKEKADILKELGFSVVEEKQDERLPVLCQLISKLQECSNKQ